MSSIFNPSGNALVNKYRCHHGYVAKLLQLPLADARLEGLVVFCSTDKRFYECVHTVTDTEDYYRWIAVTSGDQRRFFIPVERLTEEELPEGESPSIRTNCFDAIAAATDTIVIGLYRYNVGIMPLCYKPCYDQKYVDGKKYYIYNNSFDRAQYVLTKDTVPVADKPYFIRDEKYKFVTVIFEEGESFTVGTSYYESTRPMFVLDPMYNAGGSIDHRVYVSNGQKYDELTMKHLVVKINEIIDVVNVTNSKLSKASNDGTLFDLCVILNALIDELNPFASTWNNVLDRLREIEEALQNSSEVGSRLNILEESQRSQDESIDTLETNLQGVTNSLAQAVETLQAADTATNTKITTVESNVNSFSRSFAAQLNAVKDKQTASDEKNVQQDTAIEELRNRIDSLKVELPSVVSKNGVYYTLDFEAGEGSRLLTCTKIENAPDDLVADYVMPLTVVRAGKVYAMDFDDEGGGVRMVTCTET